MAGAKSTPEIDRLERVRVEVACGDERRQRLLELTVPRGLTVREVVDASSVLEEFPELAAQHSLAVWGKLVDDETPVQGSERIEVLGALRVDPKEARRRRASLKAKQKVRAKP